MSALETERPRLEKGESPPRVHIAYLWDHRTFCGKEAEGEQFYGRPAGDPCVVCFEIARSKGLIR